MCVCVCVSVCVCVCLCVCVRETDRQTDRQTVRDTEKEGAMQREGKTGTQTYRKEGSPYCMLNPTTCHARAIPYDIYCGALGSVTIVYSLPSCAASQAT